MQLRAFALKNCKRNQQRIMTSQYCRTHRHHEYSYRTCQWQWRCPIKRWRQCRHRNCKLQRRTKRSEAPNKMQK